MVIQARDVVRGWLAAQRNDQSIVVEPAAIGCDMTCGEIEAGDLGDNEFNTVRQYAAHRQCERFGIDLADGGFVQLKLQQVIIVMIDQNHAQIALVR